MSYQPEYPRRPILGMFNGPAIPKSDDPVAIHQIGGGFQTCGEFVTDYAAAVAIAKAYKAKLKKAENAAAKKEAKKKAEKKVKKEDETMIKGVPIKTLKAVKKAGGTFHVAL